MPGRPRLSEPELRDQGLSILESYVRKTRMNPILFTWIWLIFGAIQLPRVLKLVPGTSLSLNTTRRPQEGGPVMSNWLAEFQRKTALLKL